MSQLRIILFFASLSFARIVIAAGDVAQDQLVTNSSDIKSDKVVNFSPVVSNQSNNVASHVDYPNNRNFTNRNQADISPKKRQKIYTYRNGHEHQNFSLLSTVFENLDKIDIKKLISRTINQLQKGRGGFDFAELVSNLIKRPQPNQKYSISSRSSNSNDTDKGVKAKINGSAIVAEGDNLLSITKQLVKLARTGFVDGEFSPSGQIINPGSNSMFNPLIGVPSMLGSSSYPALQASADESGDHKEHHHHEVGKGDMFWVVMPALIAVGAGVIVVPLIAAWLISSAMSQNTMTVAAGRRRRRRDVLDQFLDPLSIQSTHSDLFRMLDIHRILEDAPDLVISKLSRLHDALESVGKNIINSKVLDRRFPYSHPTKIKDPDAKSSSIYSK